MTIAVDPTAAKTFLLMKAPRDLTIVGVQFASAQALGAGTAGNLSLQNWGTAGTVVNSGGTITAAVGAGVSADVPQAVDLVSAAAARVLRNEWVAVRYTETGGGWQSGDRLMIAVNYVLGKA